MKGMSNSETQSVRLTNERVREAGGDTLNTCTPFMAIKFLCIRENPILPVRHCVLQRHAAAHL